MAELFSWFMFLIKFGSKNEFRATHQQHTSFDVDVIVVVLPAIRSLRKMCNINRNKNNCATDVENLSVHSHRNDVHSAHTHTQSLIRSKRYSSDLGSFDHTNTMQNHSVYARAQYIQFNCNLISV